MKNQSISKRRYTGSKLSPYRKFRKYEMGRDAIETKIGLGRSKIIRARGGILKQKLFSVRYINAYIPKDKKVKNLEIKSFVSNHASIDYQRRNILTKGAIVLTDIGKVKITSRPGQTGSVSGILIEE